MRVVVLIVMAGLSGCMAPELSSATLAARAKASAQHVGGTLSDVHAGETYVDGDLAIDQGPPADVDKDNQADDADAVDAATDVGSSAADADALTADNTASTTDALTADSAAVFHVSGGIVIVPARKKTPEFAVRGEGLLNRRTCGQGLCAMGGIRP